MTHACGSRIGDRRRLRHTKTKHGTSGAGVTRTDTNKHTGRTGPHEVQRRLIGGTTANDDGNINLANELLEIQGFDGLRNMFS